MSKKEIPRLVDIAIPAPFPGPQVSIHSILEKEVTVLDYTLIGSQFAHRLDTLKISLDVNGQKVWISTQSLFIIEFFERVVHESLPARCVFSKGPGDSGDYIYTIR